MNKTPHSCISVLESLIAVENVIATENEIFKKDILNIARDIWVNFVWGCSLVTH